MGLVLAFAQGRGQAQAPVPAAGLAIEHEPPGCVAAEKYARLSACFRPEQSLARGRVYFRPAGTEEWFYVEMTGEPPCLQAVLPRPRKDLGAIEYSISGVDRELAEARTPAHVVPVTESGTCRAGPMAPVVESAAVIIGSTGGADPVGFLTGRGISTGLILGVAGGAAAVATLVLVTRGEGEERPPATAPRTTVTAPSASAGGRPHGPSSGTISSLLSELAVSGGRGRVVVDGVPASFPGPGVAAQSLALTPGPHLFQAVLVEGDGRPGFWGFDLSTLAVVPGSVHVTAGEVARIGLDHVAFRLGGQPGERVAFTARVRRE